jgi:hypothetical protein
MRRAGLAVFRLGLVAWLTAPAPALPWGSTGHHHIAQNYAKHLPPVMDGLATWDGVVDAHVMDADSRKGSVPGESYRHYIDIDYYPEFFAGTMPHDRGVLEARYGPSTVLQKGILPWAVDEVVATLAGQMAAGAWDDAAFTIADLCHYVGDAHVPLHCTLNYDGQLTGNHGIHARWESQMINLFVGEIWIPAVEAAPYPDAVDAMFDFITESWAGVAAILDADDLATAATGGAYNALYYQTLWHETGNLAGEQMNRAAQRTAGLVRSAWVAAGEPPVPGSSVAVVPAAGSGGARLWLGPNPFQDQLRVSWEGEGPFTVDLFDPRGARVKTLVREGTGAGHAVWRPGTALAAPSGVYWVRLAWPGGAIASKAVLLH